jgi:RimJ/RimL family protein N-acetyltransferase
MTALVPMQAESYDRYIQSAETDYAGDLLATGLYSEEQAYEKACADFMATAPQGYATPDNYFFVIRDDEQDHEIGFLWFCIREQYDIRIAFVCVIRILTEWRRQGHATRALKALEPEIKALGASGIELHVFAHNLGAQKLYAKLGYGQTSIYMNKRLEDVI